MNFKFNHNNLNVRDLEKSIQFYKDALGLTVVREKDAADGSFSSSTSVMEAPFISSSSPGFATWTAHTTSVTTKSTSPSP